MVTSHLARNLNALQNHTLKQQFMLYEIYSKSSFGTANIDAIYDSSI
jgi:hypothetical protein